MGMSSISIYQCPRKGQLIASLVLDAARDGNAYSQEGIKFTMVCSHVGSQEVLTVPHNWGNGGGMANCHGMDVECLFNPMCNASTQGIFISK